LTNYDEKFAPFVSVAFKKEIYRNTLSECISKKNLTQVKIAETEKYAHVTFFLNGGKDEAFNGETRILVPSPKVPTYDLKPEMSAEETTEKIIKNLESKSADVIIANFANPDMVGHTGNLGATIKSIEILDKLLQKISIKNKEVDGTLIITADHGNAEVMIDDKTDSPVTSHSTNPVPFCIVNHQCKLKKTGKLADIAPTMLEIFEIKKPAEMTGESLILH